MEERSFRPRLVDVPDGDRPELSAETQGDIEAIVSELSPQALDFLAAEMRARLSHVALHLPEGDVQEVVLRSHPIPPFFEVTTRRV